MQIVWSLPARADLRSIDTYLTQEVSPELAIRLLAAIRSRCGFLSDFPRGGRPLRDGTRVLRVFDTPYLIRYRLTADRVEVIRVHHEREDWQIEL